MQVIKHKTQLHAHLVEAVTPLVAGLLSSGTYQRTEHKRAVSDGFALLCSINEQATEQLDGAADPKE